MKRISAVFLSASVLILFLCLLMPMLLWQGAQNDAVGIIGGADGPTAILVTRLFGGFWLSAVLFWAATAFCGLFCLVFSQTVKTHCTFKTSGVALALAAVVGAGVYCAVTFVICLMVGAEAHPIALRASVILGTVCFAALLFLVWLYGKLRKRCPSGKGIAIDLLFALIYLIPFFFFCMTLGNWLG